MVPWLHRPIIFDIRTRPRSVSVSTGSKGYNQYLIKSWILGFISFNYFKKNTDLQTVNISLRTLYRPKAEFLPKIFQNLGSDYEERVLPSIINEVLKAVVVSWLASYINISFECWLSFFLNVFKAQFDASELITQRTMVSQQISKMLTERASQFGLILDDISIVNP